MSCFCVHKLFIESSAYILPPMSSIKNFFSRDHITSESMKSLLFGLLKPVWISHPFNYSVETVLLITYIFTY